MEISNQLKNCIVSWMRRYSVPFELLHNMFPFNGIGDITQFIEHSFLRLVLVHFVQQFQHTAVMLVRIAMPQDQRIGLYKQIAELEK